MGHNWTSMWPGCVCKNCGAEQVLDRALGESWTTFDENGNLQWQNQDLADLVALCDNFCTAEMTPEQAIEHKQKIQVLCDKLGIKGE